MPIGNKLTDRYEVKQTLGQGAMGSVYQAYDAVTGRDVAVKTLREAPEQAKFDLFRKECGILGSIKHPNIVEILEIGKVEEDGVEKPYYVMPLLKGATLAEWIQGGDKRLTVERTTEILSETCRGLQAAHERGLVHRDLKPGNIFIQEDGSVKILDFGATQMAEGRIQGAGKDALLYLSPEQIQQKPATALSDIFSLGASAYEAFTSRRPFDGASGRDVANAILHQIPTPASEVNPAVSPLLGRVVHKSMAKQPWNRFSTARELAESLQKAQRNEAIESFNTTRIQPRIDRAAKAFESGDLQFAAEILTELESEGYLDPAMAPLRRKIDQGVRQKQLARLLESARTRMDDEEYPLAMQKVQEALEIEPENDEALGMQREIEAKRSSSQADEWLGLARQHLDRFAFSHARQAAENVLQMRPGDKQGLELMAEIERREKLYGQSRDEKEKLYQAASEAFERQDLSAALSKMERVMELEKSAPEISSTDRSAAYQSLYDKVRSEQDANVAAYAEARRSLAEGNFKRAVDITEEALNKYPGHALFQALKLDIEDKKRQRLSAFIADVDRNVYAEPDLDKRVDILRGAAEQFPEEQYFERTLKLVREKRELVNSIVAKARRQEELGQYSEALGQWEILRTVYGQYPGLEFEIDRLGKRRGLQVRDGSKARWTEQIRRHIDRRDFKQAGTLLKEAQVEYPGDDELDELSNKIRQGEEHSAVSQFLAEQARTLSAKGEFNEAARLLRQALQTDERDTATRTLLIETLVKHANSLLDSDRKRAGELAQSALDLDPANAQARSAVALIAERKRDDGVEQSVNRAKELQGKGDLSGAVAAVEQALLLYPAAARLLQLRLALQRSVAEGAGTQSRRADLEKLTRLEARAETERDPNAQREILAGVRELAAKHLDDPEFQTALIGVEKRYVALNRPVAAPDATVMIPIPSQAGAGNPVKWSDTPKKTKPGEGAPADAKPAPSKPPAFPIPAPVAGAGQKTTPPVEAETAVFSKTAITKGAPTPPAAAPPHSPPPPPPHSPPPPRNWRTWAAFAGGILLVLIAGIGALLLHRPAQKNVTGALFPVAIRTVPDGANILVNNKNSGTSNLQLQLAPGVYRINAVREGYQPAQTTVTVTARGATADINLQPLASMVRLLTDFTPANVTFDGQPQTNLQNGTLILDNVAGGPHVLTLKSGASSAAIHFEARSGAPPVVTGVESAKDTSAILITNLGSNGRLYANLKAGTITMDGKPAGQVDPLGVELTNVSKGDHEVTVGDGDERRKVIYENVPVPAITVYLNSNRNQQNVGTVVVTTGEDGAVVSIDGKPQRAMTQRGQLRIGNLAPKQYVISVVKDGFQTPAEQRVTVNKGEEAKLAFQLHQLPKIATLHVAGGLPGTQILVDGKPVGTVGPDGTMAAAQFAPGSHRVELRKEEYRPKTYELSFGAGENRTLSGSDVALEATFGTLAISVTPPNAQLSIQRSGEQPRPLAGNPAHLAEGTYTVTASLPRFTSKSVAVEIAAGGAKNVTIQLEGERAAAPTPKPAVRLGMSGWADPQAWQADGDHFTRKGGNLALFKPEGSGTYSFTASMKHGKQLRWVAHVIDDRNYAEFQLDSDYFYRIQVTDGKAKELVKKKHQLLMQPIGGSLQVTISPTGIVQRIHTSAGWLPLDSWPGPSLHEGSFGFLIRGRDEVNLSDFSFVGSE